MSALHAADLTNRLNDYLGRRQPPRSFAADDRRKADQMAAYVAILRKFAPHSDALDEWWGKFLEALSEVSDTWAWPSEGDVSKACKAASKQVAATGPVWEIDPLTVAQRRIENDEPIGDSWLWGQFAVQLIGRVGQAKVQERRDRHAAHLVQIYGIDAARRMVTDLQWRHSEAVKATEEARHDKPRNVNRPVIRSVSELLGPGPEYVPYVPTQEAAE